MTNHKHLVGNNSHIKANTYSLRHGKLKTQKIFLLEF